MNNLNVQSDPYASTRQPGIFSQNDGPRRPAPIRATGPPNDIILECPESRGIDYGLDWYRLPDMPAFVICTRCYTDHIQKTSLAGQFERITQPEGSSFTCDFWFPRVKEILWPQAVHSNDLSALRAYMTRRLEIPACRGRVQTTAADGVKYYGLAEKGIIDGFIACETCYEDRIAGTAFEPRFSPYRQQVAEEKWMCDLCLPYLTTAVGKMSKNNDWEGFVASMKHRIELPVCEGAKLRGNAVKWFVPRKEIKGMRICEACYLDKLALTRFGPEFQPHVSTSTATGFDAMMERLFPTDEASCDLASTPLSVALGAAIYQRDFSVFWNAAEVIVPLVPCTANGIIRGNWWTVNGSDLNICEACYNGILKTTNVAQYFEQAQRDQTIDIVCSLCPASHRFAPLLNRFAEALDKGVFSHFSDYATKWAGVPACPGINAIRAGKWWAYGELLACQDCWLSVVSDTPLASSMPVKGVTDERALICQFWSPRIRKMWLEVCKAGEPGSPESEAAVEEFKAFGTRRMDVYNATRPQIIYIEGMREMRMMQAMNQGQLSIMYQGMNSMASLSGTTDGYLHGNSSLGYYETEHGATSAQMMNNMQTGMANANNPSDVMQLIQLKMMWAEVE